MAGFHLGDSVGAAVVSALGIGVSAADWGFEVGLCVFVWAEEGGKEGS